MGCVQLWVKEREHEVKRAGVIQIARGNKRSKRKNEGTPPSRPLLSFLVSLSGSLRRCGCRGTLERGNICLHRSRDNRWEGVDVQGRIGSGCISGVCKRKEYDNGGQGGVLAELPPLFLGVHPWERGRAEGHV